MSSENLKTVQLQISWDNIESWIAAGIQAWAKGKFKAGDEIKSIKLDYSGGHVAQDKVIPVSVILEKGVRIIRFDGKNR